MTLQETSAETTESPRQTRREMQPASAAELLIRIRNRYPNETKEQIEAMFLDRMRDYEHVLDEVGRSYFRLNFNTLTKPRPTPQAKAEKKREADALVAQMKETMKAAMVRIVLLDLTLPNGKPLKDCTGDDCAKAGGWFTKIAGKVKPGEIVGKVLSEQQVRSLYGR